MECARQEERRINRRSISTIPISRHHVANLSLETPTILNRHHIRIISKHIINKFPHEMSASPHHVREVQQLPGYTENFPQFRLSAVHRPLLTQQPLDRDEFVT